MEATTFREAYEVLQRHANTLRQQSEPNIDDLLDIVNESVAAYKVCKARIDAVEKALGEALEGAGLDDAPRATRASDSTAVSPEGSASPPVAKGKFDDMDDDIPF